MRALALLIPALTACKSEPAPTYHADASPILQQHCTRCHNADGMGTGDFTDPSVAIAMAPAMIAAIDAGRMPPPAADPECRDYVGSEFLHLPAEKRDVLAAWADAGALLGDPADAPADVPQPMTQLTEWDMEVMMEHAYTPTFSDPSNPGNEYRCFAVDHGQTEPFFITGMAPVVGADALVHHIVVYRLKKTDLPEGYDPTQGVDCIGMTDVGEGMIAGWAPGAMPLEFPEGVGLEVKPTEYLVFQMHYFDSGEAGRSDQSGYHFRTTAEVDTKVEMLPIGLYDFNIPAGDPAYEHADGMEIPSPYYVDIWGVFPHMHVLGKSYKVWMEHADGTEACIVASDRYDFNNQLTYGFTAPVHVSSGTAINLSCTWDNSAENPNQMHVPPSNVRYGERTDEEMCYAFSLVSYGVE